jgi:hypothetical protein
VVLSQRLTWFLQITSTSSQARLERDRGDLQDEEKPHWLGGELLYNYTEQDSELTDHSPSSTLLSKQATQGWHLSLYPNARE